MKKNIFVFIAAMIICLGCARVRVEAPKEPIRVDISMRLDVYQHVQKDIDEIESIVSGSKNQIQPSDKQSRFDYFIPNVYAQEDLSPQVEQAALRRKERYPALFGWMGKQVIGEDKNGLLQIRDTNSATAALEQLVQAENDDRMIIYKTLAKNNQTPVDAVQQLYAQRLQKDAPKGTPLEVLDATTGQYRWMIK